jgi:hypothetical protein
MTDYYPKYLKYKHKYLELKENEAVNQSGGANKWCKLPKNAKLYFGSGGSYGIIAVLEDIAYKYFPVLIRPGENKERIQEQINDNKYEIEVIKELTNKIIKTKLSPHLVEYYGFHKCNEIPHNIFKDCNSYTEMLVSKEKPSAKCNMLYKGYPVEVYKPMYILEMEKADGTLGGFIEGLAKQRWLNIEKVLNILFFQVFYTLETIKLVYPDYTHNDLFIRNVMYKNINYTNNDFIRYNYKNMVFDVPANILFIKINDFGMNNLSSKFHKENNLTRPFIKNPYRDYFSIIYDIYNGGNLGGKSLLKLIKNKDKIENIDKYFNKLINVKNIKKIIKNNNKRCLDWEHILVYLNLYKNV